VHLRLSSYALCLWLTKYVCKSEKENVLGKRGLEPPGGGEPERMRCVLRMGAGAVASAATLRKIAMFFGSDAREARRGHERLAVRRPLGSSSTGLGPSTNTNNEL